MNNRALLVGVTSIADTLTLQACINSALNYRASERCIHFCKWCN